MIAVLVALNLFQLITIIKCAKRMQVMQIRLSCLKKRWCWRPII